MPAPLRLLAVMTTLLLVIGGGCRPAGDGGAEEAREEIRIVSQVLSTSDPLTYDVGWFPSGCEEFERVDIEEAATEVGLTVWVWVDSSGCEELSGETSTTITLTEPLGDRTFVDANLGSTVKVDADPGPPEDLDP